MYPYERSLVAKYKDRPFVILGVNSDSDRDGVKQAIAAEHIAWRSWWAGGVDSGIAQLYHVQHWPTLYLLDGRGTIRFAHVHGQALDNAIELLVREAENGKPH
jgi:hypothetical protein